MAITLPAGRTNFPYEKSRHCIALPASVSLQSPTGDQSAVAILSVVRICTTRPLSSLTGSPLISRW